MNFFLENNYRPADILSSVSKIYERSMYDQINEYFPSCFSKLQCGFRKGSNAQHCLLVLIEKCHEILDKHDYTALREKCPNTEFFLVRIFPYSD